jgi:hypothetical protein
MNIDERMFCILLLILTLKSGIEILKKRITGEKHASMCDSECRLYLSEYGGLETGDMPYSKRKGADFKTF